MFAVREAVERALAEDLTPLGDLTAALIPPGVVGWARFVAREEGVLAGRLCADEAFAQVEPSIDVNWNIDDGGEVSAGEAIADIRGPLASILTAERTALNFLCRLSGIASITRRYVRTARGKARILDTRKTTPGLRSIEKAAVRAGGAANHRGSLSEFVLVKDNHLAGLSIGDAVRRARLLWPARTVEVECDRIEQVQEALDAGADLVMLDNMEPDLVAQCVELIDRRAKVEVSGGITLANLGDFADAGADFISVGALTHSAPVLDIGLDFSDE